MAFATVDDVATYLRRPLDSDDRATAAQALDIATQMIRSYTGQQLSLVTNESVRVWPLMRNVVVLPEGPVVSVTSVTDADRGLMDGDDYVWTPWGTLTSRYWSGKPITVVYTHGYKDIPDDIRGVCIEVAKRAMENPAGLQREDLNTASQWLGLTDENKLTLSKYRLL